MIDLVSIIIPTYNSKKYLNKCLDSLINQTYKNIEIILVDDGSDDGSEIICDEYKNNYGNIKVLHKQNAGVSSARNNGIKKASGKWIMFCDSDDWYEKNAVTNVVHASVKYNCDLVMPRCVGHYYDTNDEFIEKRYDDDDFILEMNISNMSNIFHTFYDSSLLFSTGCRLYKRNIILENNINFDENMNVLEDFKFNLDYLDCSKSAIHIDSVCYNYIVVDYKTYVNKRNNARNRLNSVKNIQEKLFSFLEEHNIEKKTKYYDFITSYWIMTIDSIINSNNVSVKEKSILLKEVYKEVNKVELSKMYNRKCIDTKYHIFFKSGFVFFYYVVEKLQNVKRYLIND